MGRQLFCAIWLLAACFGTSNSQHGNNIHVRSHGQAIIPSQQEQAFDSVSELNVLKPVVPRTRKTRTRLRTKTRSPLDDVETRAAAQAAAVKAKSARNEAIDPLFTEELQAVESKLTPVYYTGHPTTVVPQRRPDYHAIFNTTPAPVYTTTTPFTYLKPIHKSTFRPVGSYDAPVNGATAHFPPQPTGSPKSIFREETSSFHQGNLVHLQQPTSSFNVPPVLIDPEDKRPRNSGHKGPTSGYYPPAQRVMPRVSHMEAECSDDVMKLRVKFNATFTGLVYSAGYSYDTDCIYINGTGADEYEFYIQLNRCGTLGGSDHNKKRDANFKNTEPTKNFMWNTVTIQYSPLIEEEWDEHFKVTCEYGYDFWKTVTFPFLDVDRTKN